MDGRTTAENGTKKAEAALVVALASGQSVRAASRASGVSERTIYRRLSDPAFREAVANARAAAVAQATAKLAQLSTAAVETLRRLLRAKSENIRLAAARAVLEFGGRLRESEEFSERIRKLEEELSRERSESEKET